MDQEDLFFNLVMSYSRQKFSREITKIAVIEAMKNNKFGIDESKIDRWLDIAYQDIESAKKKPLLPNIANTVRTFEVNPERFKDFAWFDTFHDKIFTTFPDGKKKEWTDDLTEKLCKLLQNKYALPRIGINTALSAVSVYAREHARCEPKDWIESLKWDEVERVSSFFETYYKAESSEYTRAVSRNFWVSIIARIMRPACQVDTMAVLEAKQGAGKTESLRIIGGEWHVDAHESVTSKGFFEMLRGRLIVEIGELDSFSRAETTRIKQVISCVVDRYRPPYGRLARDFPRRCIFVGTTNEEKYLRDHTGGRRFWPIACDSIDLEGLRRDRAQLFAEAAFLFKKGGSWWQMPSETTDIQESRRQRSAWEAIIGEWIEQKESERSVWITDEEYAEFTTKEILLDCLEFPKNRIGKWDEMRVANCCKALGLQHREMSIGGKRARYWLKRKDKLLPPPESYLREKGRPWDGE